MSYCRWSSLNGYSDAYVYEGECGYVTHMASTRPPPGAPDHGIHLLLESEGGSVAIYQAAQARWREWKDAHPSLPINHAEAGKSFLHDSPGECADNLDRLAREGFVIPAYAIEALREEEAEIRKRCSAGALVAQQSQEACE